MLGSFCSAFRSHFIVAVQTDNLRRLLRTVEALSELGPALTAERDFSETSRLMLSAIMEAAGSRAGVLLLFHDKPARVTRADPTSSALPPTRSSSVQTAKSHLSCLNASPR